jgi:hypothetical protein
MRILSTFDNSQSVTPTSKKQRQASTLGSPMEQQSAPERLSRSQILSRLEASKSPSEAKEATPAATNVSLSRASWDDVDEDEQAAEATEAKPAVQSQAEAEEVAEHLLESDVGKNDPNDEMTRSKLQTLVTSGGFNFSEKEREVLSQILK